MKNENYQNMNQPEDFIIRTSRLVLRPPDENDVESLWPHVTDKRITKFLAWEPHTDKNMTMALIRSLRDAMFNDKGYHWLIERGSEIVGLISLIDVRRKHRAWTYDRAELSYWLGPDFQGKGYATETSKAIIDFGFKVLNLHKIIIAHAEDNVESRRICNKLGFIQYAHEHDAFKKNGQWHDLIWYELINGK